MKSAAKKANHCGPISTRSNSIAKSTRVVCMEKTNIRYVVPEDIQEKPAFSSIDVSFISLTKILGPVRNLLTEDGEIVCLIKPQFEAGREKVGKKGVVRDPAVHEEVIEKVRDFAMSISLEPCHLSFSPIKGPEGNIEYLLHLKKRPEGTEVPDSLTVKVEDVVAQAHGALDTVSPCRTIRTYCSPSFSSAASISPSYSF